MISQTNTSPARPRRSTRPTASPTLLGVIIGSVDLGALDDSMANYGTINGNVYPGAGNDRFTHVLGATLNGVVDGGAATGALIIDISGGGLPDQAAFDKSRNFESQSITASSTITTNGRLVQAFPATARPGAMANCYISQRWVG